MEKKSGTEGLETKPKPKAGEKAGHKEAPKSAAKKHSAHKSGKKLTDIHTHVNDDGSFTHTHHYADDKGVPDMRSPTYSSQGLDDLHDHMEQHLGDAADAGEPDDADAAAPAAAAAAPAAGAPDPGDGGE